MVSQSGYEMGATGMQGWRLEMEDEHIITDMPSMPNHTFVAVFDGHGGAGTAAYAKKNLIGAIEATESWRLYQSTGDIKHLGDALVQGFLDLDEDLRVYQDQSSGKDVSGCTSVTAVITPTHIVCANAGDSRCILATDNGVKYLSLDHKPYDSVEKTRIINAGGTVQYDRVDGDLAVSRAFGDFQWKARADLSPQEQRVTCNPDITVHERSSKDEVLILACDGVWDVFSNEEAAALVYEVLESGETSMTLLAEEIADMALERGKYFDILPDEEIIDNLL